MGSAGWEDPVEPGVRYNPCREQGQAFPKRLRILPNSTTGTLKHNAWWKAPGPALRGAPLGQWLLFFPLWITLRPFHTINPSPWQSAEGRQRARQQHLWQRPRNSFYFADRHIIGTRPRRLAGGLTCRHAEAGVPTSGIKRAESPRPPTWPSLPGGQMLRPPTFAWCFEALTAKTSLVCTHFCCQWGLCRSIFTQLSTLSPAQQPGHQSHRTLAQARSWEEKVAFSGAGTMLAKDWLIPTISLHLRTRPFVFLSLRLPNYLSSLFFPVFSVTKLGVSAFSERCCPEMSLEKTYTILLTPYIITGVPVSKYFSACFNPKSSFHQ